MNLNGLSLSLPRESCHASECCSRSLICRILYSDANGLFYRVKAEEWRQLLDHRVVPLLMICE